MATVQHVTNTSDSDADGSNGYATYSVFGTKFLAPPRYSLVEPLVKGTYGVVCSARDDEGAGDSVAIKKVKNVVSDLRHAKELLRELRILRNLRHENVLDIRLVFFAGPHGCFHDIYVVSDLMETDLGSLLRSPLHLSDDHCEFFLYQTLRGLKFVHSAEVVHLHLMPRNLLVNSNCDLKICDFSRSWLPHTEDLVGACPISKHDGNLWYCAPEVLCPWPQFGKTVDMWSVGCIFAEMLQNKPLFPGKNAQNQLRLIIRSLGKPEQDLLRKIHNEKCKKFIESLISTITKPLGEHFTAAPALAVDLLKMTLVFNPDNRLTARSCLEHPYLVKLYCPEDEPEREPLDVAEFEFERRVADVAAIREELYLESLHYKPH